MISFLLPKVIKKKTNKILIVIIRKSEDISLIFSNLFLSSFLIIKNKYFIHKNYLNLSFIEKFLKLKLILKINHKFKVKFQNKLEMIIHPLL